MSSATRIVGTNIANKVVGGSTRRKKPVQQVVKTEKGAAKPASNKPSIKTPTSNKASNPAKHAKKATNSMHAVVRFRSYHPAKPATSLEHARSLD